MKQPCHRSTRVSFAALVLLTLAACASAPEGSTPKDRPTDDDYVTGSRIPRRSGSTGTSSVGVMSADDFSRAAAGAGAARPTKN